MKYAKFFHAVVLSLSSLTAAAHGDAKPDEGFGQAGQTDQVSRTVKITMLDTMRFKPDKLKVKKGETLRFEIHNAGAVKHEFVLGTKSELQAHNELMKQHPDMEHSDDSMVSVAPGDTAEIIWEFSRSGAVYFACLQPGHYAAGMQGRLAVSAATDTDSTHKH